MGPAMSSQHKYNENEGACCWFKCWITCKVLNPNEETSKTLSRNRRMSLKSVSQRARSKNPDRIRKYALIEAELAEFERAKARPKRAGCTDVGQTKMNQDSRTISHLSRLSHLGWVIPGSLDKPKKDIAPPRAWKACNRSPVKESVWRKRRWPAM